jgi:hypothetical protein
MKHFSIGLISFFSLMLVLFSSCKKTQNPIGNYSISKEYAIDYLKKYIQQSGYNSNARGGTDPLEIDFESAISFNYASGNIISFNENRALDDCQHFRNVTVGFNNDSIKAYIYEIELNQDSLNYYLSNPSIFTENPYLFENITGLVKIYSLELQLQTTFQIVRGSIISSNNEPGYNYSVAYYGGGNDWTPSVCTRYWWVCTGGGLSGDPIRPPIHNPCGVAGGGGSSGTGWNIFAPGDHLCTSSFKFKGSADYSFWETNMYALRFQDNAGNVNQFSAYYFLTNGVSDVMMNTSIYPSPMDGNIPAKTPLDYIRDFFPDFFSSGDVTKVWDGNQFVWRISNYAAQRIAVRCSNLAALKVVAMNPYTVALPSNIAAQNTYRTLVNSYLRCFMPGSVCRKATSVSNMSTAVYSPTCQG